MGRGTAAGKSPKKRVGGWAGEGGGGQDGLRKYKTKTDRDLFRYNCPTLHGSCLAVKIDGVVPRDGVRQLAKEH